MTNAFLLCARLHAQKTNRLTFAAAVFQPPEGVALLGPVATAPACEPVAGGLTGVTGLVAAAGVRVGVNIDVGVVAAVAVVAPRREAPGVAGATVAAGVAAVAGAWAACR